MALITYTILVLSAIPCCGDLKRCLDSFLDIYEGQNQLYLYESGFELAKIVSSRPVPYFLMGISAKDKVSIASIDFLLISVTNATIGDALENVVYGSTILASARVLVVYLGEDLEVLFAELWRYFLGNVVVITAGLDVYTYYPITKGGCVDTKPRLLGRCSSQSLVLNKESEVEYFPNCSLDFFAGVTPPFVENMTGGIEVDIVQILLEKLQFPGNVTILVNLDEVETGFGVVVSGLVNSNPQSYYDLLYYGFQEGLSVFVPLAEPKHPWENILRVYDQKVWLCIVASLVLVALVWKLGLEEQSLQSSMLYVLCIFVSCIHKQPKKLRTLFVAWSFTSFILISSYQTLLSSLMFKPTFEYQVASLEDLVTAKFEVGMHEKYKSGFELAETSKTQRKHFRNHILNCSSNSIDCYHRLRQGNFGYYTFSAKIMHYASLNSTMALYKLPTTIRHYLVMAVMKESPWSRRFGHCLRRLYESGIVELKHKYKWVQIRQVYNPKFQPITQKHLYLAFAIYVVGTVFTQLVFIAELFR